MRIDNGVLVLAVAALLGSALPACQRQDNRPPRGDAAAAWLHGEQSAAPDKSGDGRALRPGGQQRHPPLRRRDLTVA